jgi:hypothetical protein
MKATRLLPLVPPVLLAALALASVGCATENKMLQTPRYSLSYPEFWKVESVAQKDGDATHVVIGKYSDTNMNNGEGAQGNAIFETSQADVDVHIFAWPAVSGEDAKNVPMKVRSLLLNDASLALDKQGRMPEDRDECGRQFKPKFNFLGGQVDTLDMASRPGRRFILVGGQSGGTLLGVVTSVPYEQDGGLYCHNLNNMRIQLQYVLDGLTVKPAPAAAPAPATPETGKPQS